MMFLKSYFTVLTVCLTLRLSTAGLCPFSEECDCKGGDASSVRFKSAKCSNIALVKFDGPAGAYSIDGELLIETSAAGSSMPAGAFTPFSQIGTLTFHLGGGGSQQVWRRNAFDGLRVGTFSLASAGGQPFFPWRDVYPFIDSIRTLGYAGLKRLRVNGGRISVTTGLLANFNNLKSLTMENVRFDNLTKDAFADVENTLVELSLTACGILVYASQPFERLRKLEQLDLTNNTDMIFTGSSSFSRLATLRRLNLSERNSWTKKVNESVFDNLPPQLTDLSLDRVWLESIPAPIFESQVSRLSFARNFIRLVKIGEFPPNNRLTELDLSGNSIAFIYSGAFANLSSVQQLYLKQTSLDYVDLSVYSGMSALTTLAFDGQWYTSSKMKSLTASNISEVPPNLSRVTITESLLQDIDPMVKNIVERQNFQLLDLTSTSVINCTVDMKWMAKHALCAPARILIEDAYCGLRKAKPMSVYLQEIEPNPCR